MNKRLIALACVAFGVAELLLVILSWLLSATRLEGVRSLISSEGIRWFVGEFTYTLASPLLVWLLLALVALGCLQRSGLMSRGRGYRDRVALRVSLSFMIIYVVIICLLTLMPHAILLSVTGSLFQSQARCSPRPSVARWYLSSASASVCSLSALVWYQDACIRSPIFSMR